jgi:NDP-sugar pyrophosphorylase family protein
VLPVLVLCGGRGTRLEPETGGATPKALVAVAGRAFIDHKLTGLAELGFRDVVLSTGVGGDQIEAHVGDGSRFGVRVRYRSDGERLRGTGGAVQAALDLLPDTFWVTYGDSLVALDAGAAEAAFRATRRSGLMTVRRTTDPQASNARVEGDRVTAYGKEPPPSGSLHIDFGLLILTHAAFTNDPRDPPFDLAVVLGDLATRGDLTAMEVDQPFHDIGDPEALRATEAFLTAHGDDER